VSWLDCRWPDNKDLLRFFEGLIAFRKNHALFRQREFIAGPDIQELSGMAWTAETGLVVAFESIAVEFQFDGLDNDLCFIFNAWSERLTFQIPFLPGASNGIACSTRRSTAVDFADPRKVKDGCARFLRGCCPLRRWTSPEVSTRALSRKSSANKLVESRIKEPESLFDFGLLRVLQIL